MRNLNLTVAAGIILFGAGPSFAAQADPAQQPPVIQIQANPTGAGIPSETPPNPSSADSPVPPAMPADPNYNAGPYKGALAPPPPQAMDKVYPVCTRTIQDSCINPSEARAAMGTSKRRRPLRSAGR